MLKSRPLPGLIFLLSVAVLLMGFAPPAQVPVITLAARAGFDGRFRDSEWMPVIVEVRNDGDAMTGQLVVRPETSGAGVTNRFSAPVELPNGASQTITLYVTARSFASQVRVELIDNEGVVIAAEPLQIRALQPSDRLYAVVTQSAAGSVDMSGATIGNGAAYQTNWRIADIPDYAAALRSVDMILFSDVDTSGLSSAQRAALEQWVIAGGHLVVTGGAAWEATADQLIDLLPMEPSGTQTASDLLALANWLQEGQSALEGDTVLTTGTLRDDARVLVAQDDMPLVVRRPYGAGTVDYLTSDPNTTPLRGWQGLNHLWVALATTVEPEPSWANGFSNWEYATSAVEILPGYNLLPDVIPLCGFLGLYIALIGPINYFILARLNRRELAWFTIPLLIIAFSVMAWVLGFNLRGTEATISRISLVRAWPQSEYATVDGLLGLLSPRRTQYDLTPADAMLRPIPRVTQGNLLTGNVQQSIDIEQTGDFTAAGFSVDASFVAAFNATTAIPKPDISGSASMVYDEAAGGHQVRGAVSNRTDETIERPVILARGIAFPLESPLEPGDTETFEFVLPAGAPPAPLFYSPPSTVGYPSYYGYGALQSQTINDLLGPPQFDNFGTPTEEEEEAQRRRFFLGAFVNDLFLYSNAVNRVTTSTGRGDNIYLAGWTSSAPLAVELEGAQWNSRDTTLYLIELEVEHPHDAGQTRVTSDLFTWVAENQTRLGEIAPVNMALQPGDEVSFRFTPLPSAVLSEVEQLMLRMERSSVGNAELPIYLYDWERDEWEETVIVNGERIIDDPARYLGPQNAVMLRLVADDFGGYLRVDRLAVEQLGRFGA